MTPVLEVSELEVRFGGLVALDAVSLAVEEGELVGLIGPNGAGKTTLIDAVTGFVPYRGSVLVRGRGVDALRPDLRAARGLGRTFQSLELFEDLTVRENVAVAPWTSDGDTDEALAATGLTSVSDDLPGSLPPSTRRFVALARAMAGRPSVLLLDEVAAGLDRGERSVLAEALRDLVATRTGVVLVDHDVGLIADVSHRVVVLDRGTVIASGLPKDVRRDDRVLAAYLGRRR